jgi:hypothetical protein
MNESIAAIIHNIIDDKHFNILWNSLQIAKPTLAVAKEVLVLAGVCVCGRYLHQTFSSRRLVCVSVYLHHSANLSQLWPPKESYSLYLRQGQATQASDSREVTLTTCRRR